MAGIKNIKQKTQADIVSHSLHPEYTYSRTITYDASTKTLIAHNFPNSQVFNFNSEDLYKEVIPAGDENPQEEGWYESDGATPPTYTLTTDTVVYIGKIYYTKVTEVDFNVLNQDRTDRTSYTTYNNEKINIQDKGYSSVSGGGIIYDGYSTKEVLIGGDKGEYITSFYYGFTAELLGGNGQLYKFGYCCNDNYGKDFPIFIQFASEGGLVKLPIDQATMFYPSKEGMYEFQTEEWTPTQEEITSKLDTNSHIPPVIAVIWIPIGPDQNNPFSFVLDYVL